MPGISNGPNSRPLNDTVAQTGPGIPDDATATGALDEEVPDLDAQAEALRRRGWLRRAEDETEAHPS